MSAHPAESIANRRSYVLAEFRCASLRAQLAQVDIEAAAIALACHIVTPDQAIAMVCETEAMHFVGIVPGAAS